MVPIKIECPCGQHYAFEVEPAGGQMPHTVACPTCGADGTDAANSILASQTTASKAPPPQPRPGLALPGEIDRFQVETEARSKIIWGEDPQEITLFLIRNRIPRQEATALIQKYIAERTSAIRTTGLRNMGMGFAMMCTPVVGWFLHVLSISLIGFGMMCAMGAFGLWRFGDGFLQFFSPKSEKGDVADK